MRVVYKALAAITIVSLSSAAHATNPAPMDLSAWSVKGDIVVDPARKHGSGSGAFRLGPKSRAVINLGKDGKAGTISFWVYDNGKTRADGKKRHLGPRWGVLQPSSGAVAGGVAFATYLDGNQHYSVIESDGKVWSTAHHVRSPKRESSWIQWVFTFDKTQGLSVAANGQPITSFSGAKSKFKGGISGLILLGDDSPDDPITVWVDDIAVNLNDVIPNSQPASRSRASDEPVIPIKGYDPNTPTFVHLPDAGVSAKSGDAKVTLPPVAKPGEHPCLIFTPAELSAFAEELKNSERGKAVLDAFLRMAKGYTKQSITFPSIEDTVSNKAAKTHSSLSNKAGSIGLAYGLSGDVEFAKTVREILIGYASRYESYPRHSGRNKRDSSKVTFQRLSEAMWLIPLLEGYDYIYTSGVLSDADKKAIETGLIRPAIQEIQRTTPAAEVASRTKKDPAWRTKTPPLLEQGDYPNWINFYSAATMMAGAVLRDQDMIDLAASDFRSALARGIGADGMWGEGAINYQLFLMGVLVAGFEAAARQGIDLWGACDMRFKQLFDSPLRYAYPDGTLPGINDSARGRMGTWQTMVYDYGWLRYRDPKYAFLVNSSPRQLHFSEAIYQPTRIYDKIPEPPLVKTGSTLFGSLGYAIIRDDSKYLLMDYGPHGAVHGHYDKLNLLLFGVGPESKGDEIGGEPKFHNYADPLHREWTVHTVAHNTMTVDGESQRQGTGRLLVFEDTPNVKLMQAEAGTVYSGVLLNRTVVVIPNAVVDIYLGRSDAPRQWDRVFRYQGNLDAITAPGGAPLGSKDGYQHIKIAGRVAGTNPWSGTWGTKVGPFSVTVGGAPNQEMILGIGPDGEHMLLARQTGSEAAVASVYQMGSWGERVQSVNWLKGDSNVKVCEVQIGGHSLLIFVGNGQPWETQGWASDARVLVVQQGSGQKSIVIGGGSYARNGEHRLNLAAAGNALAELTTNGFKTVSSWAP